MLTELLVKNFAVIEEIRLELRPGFSVISGETGAGKSILVGALGLILGGKAPASLIRTGETTATVEALFEIADNVVLQEYLEDAGLSEGDQLIIRRQVTAEGRGRIHANGKTITRSQLETIGSYLIDLSGQHDQQILLKQENHLHLLDSFKGHHSGKRQNDSAIPDLLKAYQQVYEPYQELTTQIAQKRSELKDRQQRIDFLQYQIKEIESAQINDVGEEEELLASKGRVKNADFLNELAQSAASLLSSEDNSLLDAIDSLMVRVEKGFSSDSTLQEAKDLLEQSRNPLEEVARFFSRYSENLSVEPGRLEAIEERLYKLHQLKKKYGESLSVVLESADSFKKELDGLENADSYLEEMEKEKEKLAEKVLSIAQSLSKTRQKVASTLEQLIQKELADLSMKNVVFQISIGHPPKPCLNDCGPNGCDEVRFDFSANKGESPRPLVQIASGGELSRVLLAIKRILGSRPYPMTYIFDEVDSGIGGGVAEVVGRKLKEISANNQVLCVTHLPQIASHAVGHYVIEKSTDQKRTRTDVRWLKNATEREEEIARMLGGLTMTSKTKAHAREMLKMAENAFTSNKN